MGGGSKNQRRRKQGNAAMNRWRRYSMKKKKGENELSSFVFITRSCPRRKPTYLGNRGMRKMTSVGGEKEEGKQELDSQASTRKFKARTVQEKTRVAVGESIASSSQVYFFVRFLSVVALHPSIHYPLYRFLFSFLFLVGYVPRVVGSAVALHAADRKRKETTMTMLLMG